MQHASYHAVWIVAQLKEAVASRQLNAIFDSSKVNLNQCSFQRIAPDSNCIQAHTRSPSTAQSYDK